jgi:hypothetical protein
VPELTGALAASEWYYIGAAYGLTWTVLAGYAISLVLRSGRARARFEEARRNEGGMP